MDINILKASNALALSIDFYTAVLSEATQRDAQCQQMLGQAAETTAKLTRQLDEVMVAAKKALDELGAVATPGSAVDLSRLVVEYFEAPVPDLTAA